MNLAGDISPEGLKVFLAEADEQLQLVDEEIVALEGPADAPHLLRDALLELQREIDVALLIAELNSAGAGAGAPLARGDKVVVIGASTGGPRALGALFAGLPAGLRASFLVVQHMPVGYTASLANRLDEDSEIQVREAADGDRIRRGAALLAPGGYHMRVKPSGAIELDQGERVHGVRPSVDVTMQSAVQAFGSSVRGIVLTGMGADGTDGSGAIRAAGGKVAVEHESTCAVYGMPRSIADAGHAGDIVSLPRMARQIVEMCR